MSASMIKKEDSPELFVAETPPMSAAGSTISSIAATASPIHDGADVKPPKARPNSTVPQARFANTYRDNYKVNNHMQIPQFQIYRPIDGMQEQDPVLFPQQIQMPAAPQGNGQYHNGYAQGQTILAPQGNGQHHSGYAQGQTMPVPQGNSQFPNDYQVRLQGIHTAGYEHGSLEPIMREMSRFSNTITQLFRNMNSRMTKAEYERDVELRRKLAHESNITFAVPQAIPQTAPALGGHVRFRDADDIHFGSPVTPTKPHTFIRESFSQEPEQSPLKNHGFGSKLTGKNKKKGEKTSARKSLQIKLPSGMGMAPASSPLGGLHTPITKHASALLPGHMGPPSAPLPTALPTPVFSAKFALTPGMIGPTKVIKRTATSVNKRKTHNLDKMMPPSNAIIPMLPLTDTEVVVYFFQSISRPIVALRLYARNWGPAHIADALNAHREIEGGYLRNTASVKCLTAIKKGKTIWGEDWDQIQRPILESANDLRCTDLMQLRPDEADQAVDFDIRSLTMGLKKHPQLGVDGGIFTRCVMYCVEHNAPYTLNNVHQLAVALNNGFPPVVPPSPTDPFLRGRFERRKRGAKAAQLNSNVGENLASVEEVQDENDVDVDEDIEEEELVEDEMVEEDDATEEAV